MQEGDIAPPMKTLIEINDKTWARVKYMSTLKKKKRLSEMLNELLDYALTEYEFRGRL